MGALTSFRARPVRVIYADDHEILRESFEIYLKGGEGLDIISTVSNGRQLIDCIQECQPEVVITDIQMPVMDGIEATRYISRHYPQIPVLALTVFSEEHKVLKMLEAGASGYLLKNAPRDEILEAIHTVRNGENYFCKSTSLLMAKLIGRSQFNLREQRPIPAFSEKEREIITHICEEKANKEIAQVMNLNQRTLESARERIFKKMGVRSTAGMIIYAIRHGLYQL